MTSKKVKSEEPSLIDGVHTTTGMRRQLEIQEYIARLDEMVVKKDVRR